MMAELCADLGDKDGTFRWLDTAYLERDYWLAKLAHRQFRYLRITGQTGTNECLSIDPETRRRMAVVFAINGQPVRASERKCRPPCRALFRASRATAGLSLPAPRRMRRPVVEVAWVMRREYCERP